MEITVVTDDGRTATAPNIREAISALYDFHTVINPTTPTTAEVIKHGAVIGRCRVEGVLFNTSLMDEIQARGHRRAKLAADLRHERDILARLAVDAYYKGLASQRELGTHLGISSVAVGRLLREHRPLAFPIPKDFPEKA
ncbi:MAG: hypothetical protein Q3962_02440 [Corynebacterium sp.]|nr:hypothetical protein [Corynebacterium sp.]